MADRHLVPKLQYPKGYRVKVRGGEVISRAATQHLIVRGFQRSQAITVSVTPR